MFSILVSFLTGILLSLAFPRANLHFLAWFAVAPLMYYIYLLRWRNALAAAFAFGFGFFGVLLYWIAIFGKLPWVLLAVHQALFIVAVAFFAKLIGSRLGLWGRLALLPALWVISEWTRSKGMIGFTWGDLGYSQYRVLPAIQVASFAGVWGVSFLIAATNAVIANALTSFRGLRSVSPVYPQIALVFGMVAAVFSYGWYTLGLPADDSGRPIRAAVVQGNILQADWDAMTHFERSEATWDAYDGRTLEVGKQGADLIVWPETVVPGAVDRDTYLQERLKELAADAGAMLLVGAWGESGSKTLNSAYLIDPIFGLTSQYSKVHLVPFGEFVPVREYLPFLERYRVRSSDTAPGPGFTTMSAGDLSIGTAICFESAFPEIPRELTQSGAELLCVITDDEWFLNTPAAEQHMSKSVLRAVENRRYLVRAASTGISCIIDSQGRILNQVGLWKTATISAEVRSRSDRTPFTRYGDWMVYLSLVLVVLLGLNVALRQRETPENRALESPPT